MSVNHIIAIELPKSFPYDIQDHEVWIWLDTDVEAVSSTLDRVVLREALKTHFYGQMYVKSGRVVGWGLVKHIV